MNIYFIIQILRSGSGVFFIKSNDKVELLFLSFRTYQPRPWWLSFERDDCVTMECSFTPISRSPRVICCLIADIFLFQREMCTFFVMFAAIFDSLAKSHENKKSNSCCTTGYFPCEGLSQKLLETVKIVDLEQKIKVASDSLSLKIVQTYRK